MPVSNLFLQHSLVNQNYHYGTRSKQLCKQYSINSKNTSVSSFATFKLTEKIRGLTMSARKNKTSGKPTKFLDPTSQVLTLFLESPSQFGSSSVCCSHTPEIHFLEFCKPISVREKLKIAKKAKLKKKRHQHAIVPLQSLQ